MQHSSNMHSGLNVEGRSAAAAADATPTRFEGSGFGCISLNSSVGDVKKSDASNLNCRIR